MRKKSTRILAIVLLSSTISFAQIQGKAVYQTKTTMELNLDESQYTPEQRKRIEERMKNRLEKVYALDFNAYESVYQEEDQLEQPDKNNGRMRFGGFSSGEHYKNTKAKTYSKEEDLMGKEFLIKDSLLVFDWEFLDESKMIGQHLCLKAIAKRKVPNIENFRFGRGRQANTVEEKPKDSLKEIEVVAWYALDIPVNHGPGEYWGLPGLILELNADKTQIVCTQITINPKKGKEIKAPKKGKEVSQKEFNSIRREKMEEMREIYGNNRRDDNQRGRR